MPEVLGNQDGEGGWRATTSASVALTCATVSAAGARNAVRYA